MHNIESPRVDDGAIEQEIQAKGLIAPRVTPADIEAAIFCEYGFTAAEAIRDMVPGHPSLGLLTFCVLVLRNGFTVTGESACASPENFNAALGLKIARANAVQKVWPLLGFRLRDRLCAEDHAGQSANPMPGDGPL